MDEDYKLYQEQPGSNYLLNFEIDVNLLNTLRSFEHKDHEFKEGIMQIEMYRVFGIYFCFALLLSGQTRNRTVLILFC